MDTRVVLCADTDSLKDPRLIGLEGETLDAQKWLRVFCSAVEARKYLRGEVKPREVWVASSDEVDPINLAAALKKDSQDKGVFLLAFQNTGSLESRARAAGIEGTLSKQAFLSRYSECKQDKADQSAITSATTIEGSPERSQTHAKGKTQEAQLTFDVPPISPLPESPSLKTPRIPSATPGKTAHVLSVVSASGGSGKSTVSALAAILSQGLGYRTLLMDADLQFGDMQFFLGAEAPLSIDKVLGDSTLLAQLKPDVQLPALLSPPQLLEHSETVSKDIPVLLEQLKPLFDVIIINTGAFWTEQHAALLERSSTALFLLDQRPSSLRACKHALDLCSRCGIATHPFLFALNRCARNAPLTSIDVSCALQGAHVLELRDGGREVTDFLGAAMPFELIKKQNNLCLSIQHLLTDVLPRTVQAERPLQEKRKGRAKFGLGRKRRRAACL